MNLNPFGFLNFGRTTASFGTVYTLLIPPLSISTLTLIDFLQFTISTTAHTLTIMRPLSSQQVTGQSHRCSAYLTALAADTQAVININQDPGVFTAYTFNGSSAPKTANNVIAASDYVAFQYPDGTWGLDTVASVSTLAVTLTNNLSTGGLAAAAPLWFFGISTDTNPADGKAHAPFTLPASTIANFGDEGKPFFSAFKAGEPLLIYVNNATAASVLERASAIYVNRGGPYQS